VSEFYEGQQFLGMDLHRRRSVLVRMTEAGEHLETVRIVNTRDQLAEVMSRAGESPEVVLEATYGWYWAADALAEFGATVHLAHPLGVKAFSYRRVKNDQRDASDLADLLRMGRLPHAWNAPPETRELRELVRHRAKLVAMRSQCKAHVHGRARQRRDLGADYRPVRRRRHPTAGQSHDARTVQGADRLTAAADRGTRLRDRPVLRARSGSAGSRSRLLRHPADPRHRARAGGGVRRGDRGRAPLRWPAQLACWAGLTPSHHESDTTVHRARITKQGSRLVRWAAIESVQILPKTSHIGSI
jgi:transposase